jgi:hypothetical protein
MAFGSQEWLISATTGETEAPIGSNDGDVTVNVFATN